MDPLWIPANALGVIGAVLVIVGLPAAFVRVADATGLSGVLGLTSLVVAWMFFGLFFSLYGVLVLPWLAEKAPRSLRRARRFPRPCGPASSLAVNLLSNMSPLLLLAGLACLARSESEVTNVTRHHQRSERTTHVNQ